MDHLNVFVTFQSYVAQTMSRVDATLVLQKQESSHILQFMF